VFCFLFAIVVATETEPKGWHGWIGQFCSCQGWAAQTLIFSLALSLVVGPWTSDD
jgi:hypothetical protein